MNRQKNTAHPFVMPVFASDFKQHQADHPWPIAGHRFPRLSA
jgi:hypothetical protein